jgi:hypothetical protein
MAIVVYYLWEGANFIPNPTSEYFITDHLKKLKMELQSEIKAEACEKPDMLNGCQSLTK